jgi:hypothetical protein
MSFSDHALGFALSLARASENWASINFCRAGTSVQVRVHDSNLPAVVQQLGHLIWELESECQITFIEYSDEIRFPFEIDAEYSESAFMDFRFVSFLNVVVISDRRDCSHYVIYRDSPPFSSDYLRVIFQLLVPSTSHPVHGGSVSWGSSAVLLSNVGGSGKSSLIASAVLIGASTTGDDFGLFELGAQGATVWSQFSTFKLAESSPASRTVLAPAIHKNNDKNVYELEKLRPGSAVPSHLVNQIMIPYLGETFAINAISPTQAFRQIAPSSSGLALDRQRTNLAISELCQKLPAFNLVLSPDTQRNAEMLREAIDR